VRIICPFTPDGIQPATVTALEGLDRPVEFWAVSADCQAYFRLLGGLWAAADDFLVVEHDMVPTVAMVEEMEACPQAWCTNPYVVNEWGTLIEAAFGFTRFRRRLMTAEPDAMEATVAIPVMVNGHMWPARHWQGLDCRFDCVLGGRSYRQHAHAEIVDHLHRYP
jgi:hypothetical protein